MDKFISTPTIYMVHWLLYCVFSTFKVYISIICICLTIPYLFCKTTPWINLMWAWVVGLGGGAAASAGRIVPKGKGNNYF